jgi:transcriptional repressor NrdR
VVDSRTSEDGTAIRRRRECAGCGRRFTTFERADELPLNVAKRSGLREPFDRTKIVAGLRAATKNRPVTSDQLEALASSVEDHCRLEGGEVTSESVGLAVLERLRELDQVSSVRFASVYKEFDDPADFARELHLLTKETAPKGTER